jgi:RNA polymerase sigma factor (sigma-70 family)
MGNCTKGSLNENLLEVQNETGFSQKKINSLYNLPSGKTSLDIEVGGESLVNLIPSKEISQENLWKKELNKDIMNCLKTLSQDEKTIIVNSYGLGDNEPLLLREIGKILRISAEAVRQKKEEILKRLKLKKYSEPFEDYFYNQ